MLVIHITTRFKRSFKKLPKSVRLDFAQLKGNLDSSRSFYLKNGYRVLVDFLDGNEVLLVDVGNHDEYRKWEKN